MTQFLTFSFALWWKNSWFIMTFLHFDDIIYIWYINFIHDLFLHWLKQSWLLINSCMFTFDATIQYLFFASWLYMQTFNTILLHIDYWCKYSTILFSCILIIDVTIQNLFCFAYWCIHLSIFSCILITEWNYFRQKQLSCINIDPTIQCYFLAFIFCFRSNLQYNYLAYWLLMWTFKTLCFAYCNVCLFSCKLIDATLQNYLYIDYWCNQSKLFSLILVIDIPFKKILAYWILIHHSIPFSRILSID